MQFRSGDLLIQKRSYATIEPYPGYEQAFMETLAIWEAVHEASTVPCGYFLFDANEKCWAWIPPIEEGKLVCLTVADMADLVDAMCVLENEHEPPVQLELNFV